MVEATGFEPVTSWSRTRGPARLGGFENSENLCLRIAGGSVWRSSESRTISRGGLSAAALKYRGPHCWHPPLGRTLDLNPDTRRCEVLSDRVFGPALDRTACPLMRERFGESAERGKCSRNFVARRALLATWLRGRESWWESWAFVCNGEKDRPPCRGET